MAFCLNLFKSSKSSPPTTQQISAPKPVDQPYRHIPTHAMSDAFSQGPPGAMREEDRKAVQMYREQRAALSRQNSSYSIGQIPYRHPSSYLSSTTSLQALQKRSESEASSSQSSKRALRPTESAISPRHPPNNSNLPATTATPAESRQTLTPSPLKPLKFHYPSAAVTPVTVAKSDETLQPESSQSRQSPSSSEV